MHFTCIIAIVNVRLVAIAGRRQGRPSCYLPCLYSLWLNLLWAWRVLALATKGLAARAILIRAIYFAMRCVLPQP